MIDVLKDAKIPKDMWPRIINMDDDANTVVWTRIMFPDYVEDIRFTRADPQFQPNPPSKLAQVGVGIEEHIAKSGSLTDKEKRSVVRLYLDYPGGPPLNQQPDKCRLNFTKNIWPHLPGIKIYAVTISYRKHDGLKHGTTHFVPPPHGFNLIKSFNDNKLVRCEMFTTRAVQVDNLTNTNRLTVTSTTCKTSKKRINWFCMKSLRQQ